MAYGLIRGQQAFLRNFWNIYDTVILVLFIMYIQDREALIVDFTPFRMLRLLSYMGGIFEGTFRLMMVGLNVMLSAIKGSLKMLFDGLLVVLVFSLFFTAIGLIMFKDLLNQRCMNTEYGFY
jgi:hypothetical protein